MREIDRKVYFCFWRDVGIFTRRNSLLQDKGETAQEMEFRGDKSLGRNKYFNAVFTDFKMTFDPPHLLMVVGVEEKNARKGRKLYKIKGVVPTCT